MIESNSSPNSTELELCTAQSTRLREVVAQWAHEENIEEPYKVLAYLMNLTLQFAFAIGSNTSNTHDQLIQAVDRATSVYGSFLGNDSSSIN